MATALLEWETLDSTQVEEIMRGEAPTPPSGPGTGGRPEDGARPKGKDPEAPTLDESDLDLNPSGSA